MLQASGGVVNKQIKASLPEPRAALTSFAVTCVFWFLSASLLCYLECLPIVFQVRKVSTDDSQSLIGWFFLGPKPCSSGPLVSGG